MKAPVRAAVLALPVALLMSYGSTLSAHAASAATSTVPFAKEGFRLGVLFPRVAIDGDFDGDTILVGPNEILLVPKVNADWGYGVSVGTRSGNSSIDLNYQRTKHDVTFLNAVGEAVFETYNIDFRYYFLSDKRIQPYLLIGWIPYARLVVKDGSANTKHVVGDAKFSSAASGLNLGAGLEVFLTKRLSLQAGAVFRWMSFEEGKGVQGEWREMKDSLSADGINLLTGVSYCF
jgi:opacity protein-like surface antigen